MHEASPMRHDVGRRDGRAHEEAHDLRVVGRSPRSTPSRWPAPRAFTSGRPEGKRFIDFNSQLMCVNIGHGDQRVIRAIQAAGRDAGLRQPVHGHRAARAARGEAGRDHAGRHRHVLLHQRRRRGQRERHQDGARSSRAGTRSWRATGRTTAARPARSRSPATLGAGPPSRACPGSSTCSTRTTASQRGWDTVEQSLADARGGDPARRAAAPSRRSSSSR